MAARSGRGALRRLLEHQAIGRLVLAAVRNADRRGQGELRRSAILERRLGIERTETIRCQRLGASESLL